MIFQLIGQKHAPYTHALVIYALKFYFMLKIAMVNIIITKNILACLKKNLCH